MFYLDTSAFLKLLVQEEHSDTLRRSILNESLWASTLLAVEAHRAASRLAVPAARVDELLDSVTLVIPAEATFLAARSIGEAQLRTLDALHLASAAELGEDLDALVTYDRRLAARADALGIQAASPGQAAEWWTTPS